MTRRRTNTVPEVRGGAAFPIAWLAIAAAHAVVVAMRLAVSPVVPWTELMPFLAYTATMAAAWALHSSGVWRFERNVFLTPAILVGLGIAMQFRMGTFAPGHGAGFALAIPLGLAAMAIVFMASSGGRWRFLGRAGSLCYLLAIAALGAMLVLGRRYRGGIYLPGNINPSEIVKPLLVVFLASRLAKTGGAKRKGAAAEHRTLLALWAFPMLLVLALRDLGLLVLLGATFLAMLYAAERRISHLLLGAVAVAAACAGLCLVSAHARVRFDVWLHPFNDPTGSGWQILQSLSAMNAGGIWGAGIGAGTPQSVPIASSDFIYAVIAEELGIVVCALVLLLYWRFFADTWRIGSAIKDPFGASLSFGMTAVLALQTIINIGGVTKAIPLTGIALPFLSQGGSSLATSLAMVGLLMAMREEPHTR